MDIRNCNLHAINSATKYPSIPTYHEIGNRGILQPTCVPMSGNLYVTEKCDGTNARIILLPGGMFIIGSREDLLYAKGDIIGNPALGIVSALKDIAHSLVSSVPIDESGVIGVVYGEVYGGKISSSSKQYTNSNKVGFRMFDVATVPVSILERPVPQIASWRDNGGQDFTEEENLNWFSFKTFIPRVHPILSLDASEIPIGISETHQWLNTICSETRMALDEGHKGLPEGVIVRDATRKQIVKIRHEDYQRTKMAGSK